MPLFLKVYLTYQFMMDLIGSKSQLFITELKRFSQIKQHSWGSTCNANNRPADELTNKHPKQIYKKLHILQRKWKYAYSYIHDKHKSINLPSGSRQGRLPIHPFNIINYTVMWKSIYSTEYEIHECRTRHLAKLVLPRLGDRLCCINNHDLIGQALNRSNLKSGH